MDCKAFSKFSMVLLTKCYSFIRRISGSRLTLLCLAPERFNLVQVPRKLSLQQPSTIIAAPVCWGMFRISTLLHLYSSLTLPLKCYLAILPPAFVFHIIFKTNLYLMLLDFQDASMPTFIVILLIRSFFLTPLSDRGTIALRF